MLKIALALALTLAAGSASAIDFGAAIGAGQSGSVSQAGSQSVGGSAAAIAGVTGQASQGSASSGGFAAGGFTGNNQWSVSNHQSNTAQSGGAFGLGLAGSANQNQTVGQGQSGATNGLLAGWLFVGP